MAKKKEEYKIMVKPAEEAKTAEKKTGHTWIAKLGIVVAIAIIAIILYSYPNLFKQPEKQLEEIPTATLAATQIAAATAASSTSQQEGKEAVKSCSGFEVCGAADKCCPVAECDALLDADCSANQLGKVIVTDNNFEVAIKEVSFAQCDNEKVLRVVAFVKNADANKQFFSASFIALQNFETNNLEQPSNSVCAEKADKMESGDLQPSEKREGAVYFRFAENNQKNNLLRIGIWIRGNFINAQRYLQTFEVPK